MSKPVVIFMFIWAKIMTIVGKQNLNELSKCYGKWQLYHLFYTSESKRKREGGCKKFIGDRLGRREKAEGEISGTE